MRNTVHIRDLDFNGKEIFESVVQLGEEATEGVSLGTEGLFMVGICEYLDDLVNVNDLEDITEADFE